MAFSEGNHEVTLVQVEMPRTALAYASAKRALQLTPKPAATPHCQSTTWEGSSIQDLLPGVHSSVMKLSRTGSELPKVCAQTELFATQRISICERFPIRWS